MPHIFLQINPRFAFKTSSKKNEPSIINKKSDKNFWKINF